MKLETFLEKDSILTIDALGRDARLAAEETIEKYERKIAWAIASRLGEIVMGTGDKDVIIESARTIGRYEGEAASNVALGLGEIAIGAKDKDAIIESARMIGRYEEAVAGGIALGLGEIAFSTKDKSAVIESARTIGRYEGGAASNVAWGLGEIAFSTKDKSAVIESARTIGRYEVDTARGVAWGLRNIAFNTRDKDAVRAACDIVNKVGKRALDLLNYNDIIVISRKGLDKLIDRKEDFDSVIAYVRSGCILPLPTKENIKTYRKLASGYVFDTYGISKELGIEKMLMLFSIDEEERKGLAELVNKSTEKNRKEYSVSAGESKTIKVDRRRLPYLLLLAVTGSRDKIKEEEAFRLASSIVGEKTVNRARNSFNSSYKSKLPEIISYVKKDEVDKAIMILKETKDESINDVLACMDYRDTGFSRGNAVLSAVESNDPLDYDSRVQIACVYLPRDYDDGIYEYCKDDRFTLVRYDIGGKTLGSAICYMEDGTFLVDSVEGHRTFRKPKIFDAVRRDLVERAKEKGAKRILFSEGGTNETPKEFMEYLGHLGLEKGKIKMKLDPKGYLEADEAGASGYVLGI